MTPVLAIKKRHRRPVWLMIDLRDDDDVEAVVVIPAFGRDHNAGMDCWCHPREEPGLFVHNAEN